ncbi:hypothetical protein LCGC14_0792130, partial [marine sediment metagenome]
MENKKKKKLQLKLISGQNVIEFQGKKFRPKSIKSKMIDGEEHDNYEIWEEINDKEYAKHIDIIRKKIIDKIPKERIVEEVLKKYSVDALKKMANQITKKKAKATRQDGCLG